MPAADIEGTIVVKHKISKRNVTASASAYQRGAAVPLAADQEQDPLAYERSHVVVFLEGALDAQPKEVVIEQRDRRFTPDLVAIPAGSTVSFPNLDVIFHNVFSLSKKKSFDLGVYPKGQTRAVAFPSPGIVFVNCHLHPNMGAVIVVSPNHWVSRADRSGKFVLADAPAGKHTIVAWHKAAGFFRQTIHVSDDRPAVVEFFIPLNEDGVRQASLGR